VAVGLQAWKGREAMTLDHIVEDAEQRIDALFDEARDSTYHMLVRHGADADQIDEVMTFLERGLQSALRQHLAVMRDNLIAAVATRH
jgi:hypothetical protein